MRKEQSKRDFQEPENNDILEAIEIITRFSNNRYHLLSLDLIPKVVTLLQVCNYILKNIKDYPKDSSVLKTFMVQIFQLNF